MFILISSSGLFTNDILQKMLLYYRNLELRVHEFTMQAIPQVFHEVKLAVHGSKNAGFKGSGDLLLDNKVLSSHFSNQ